MALVRVCDTCMKIIEDKDYVNIEYNKHFDGSILCSRISLTLCEECCEKMFGQGHLENLINRYKTKRNTQEQIGEEE